VNDRRGRAFFRSMVSIMGILSGASHLMVDVRQTGRSPLRDKQSVHTFITTPSVSASVVSTSSLPSTPISASAPISGAVFYLQPSGSASTLDAYNWSGTFLRAIHTAVPIPCCVLTQSPDGSRLFYGNDVLDGQGHLLGTVETGGTWANDNRRWCAISPQNASQPFSGPGVLQLFGPPQSQVVKIGRVGDYGPHGGPSVISCDVDGGTAVVVDSSMGLILEVDVVALTTGRVAAALAS
jgi:hypothetical protein